MVTAAPAPTEIRCNNNTILTAFVENSGAKKKKMKRHLGGDFTQFRQLQRQTKIVE